MRPVATPRVASPLAHRSLSGVLPDDLPRWLRNAIVAELTLVALCVCLALALWLGAGSAQGAITHQYLYQITGLTPGLQTGIAFDAAEDVYVAGEEAKEVDRYAAGGSAGLPFECVGEGTCPGGYIEGNKIIGTPTGSGGALVPFAKTGSVAVDQATGEVYVSDRNSRVVDVFAKTGEYLRRLEGVCESPGETVGAGLCVKGRKNAKGEEESTFTALRGAVGLAFDRATGDLYIDDVSVVDVVSTTDEMVGRFGEGKAGEEGVLSESLAGTVAINEVSGDAYVGAQNDVVAVFDGSGAFVKPWWRGEATRGGSFGTESVFVGIDHANNHVFAGDNTHNVVDEFQASSMEEYVTQLTGAGTPSGGFGDVEGVGVAPDGDVFVADGDVVDVFGPDVVVPDVEVSEPPEDLTPFSAKLHGTVNPDEAGAATCTFEYGTGTSYGQSVPCEGEGSSETDPVPNGSSPVPVSARVPNLLPGTKYYYRLSASNKQKGEVFTNTGLGKEDEGTFTTPGPDIEEESVSDVRATSASLGATIVPNRALTGALTSYYFQYSTGSTAACEATPSPCISVPLPPGAWIGSGSSPVTVVPEHIVGLVANTVYHYRVVAVSEVPIEVEGKLETQVVPFYGPDQTFTTQTSGTFTLPDNRAWEMVSPPEKHGAAINPIIEEGLEQASVNGNAITYNADQPIEAEPEGSLNEVQVYSAREPGGGWFSRNIELPHLAPTAKGEQVGEQYRFFSEDLSLAVVNPAGPFDPGLSPQASEQTAYMRTDYLNGNVDEPCQPKSVTCYSPLVDSADDTASPFERYGQTSPPPGGACPPAPSCGPGFRDATPNARYVILASPYAEATDSPIALTATANLGEMYEWSEGRLQPLYLLPAAEGGMGVALGGGAHVASAEELSSSSHQLADDGSVFFVYHGHLYMHDFALDESARLDVAQGVSEPAEGAAEFLYASSDGSRVFFADPQQLTSAPGGGIYECRITGLSCALTLTGLSGKLEGGSEDASILYFLGAGEHVLIDRGEGATWQTTTGPVVPQTTESGFLGSSGPAGGPMYSISPNGLWLAFMSNEDLTGYDSRDANSGRADVEVYLYSAAANRLVCASCDPTGARPVGEEYKLKPKLVDGNRVWNNVKTWLAANLAPPVPYSGDGNGVEGARYVPRYLSNTGRLFFNSRDELVPKAVNENWDVYEYEPEGVGTCGPGAASGSVVYEPQRQTQPAGCVGLISSGSSAEESAFLDASENGSDVFFLTAAKLAPQDFDNAFDVYDAHECSEAAPCPSYTESPPECTTEAECKPAATPQPGLYGPPPSATFNGLGNLTPEAPAASGPKPKAKPLTRAQKLSKALAACRKEKKKAKRRGCEAKARRAYGAKKAKPRGSGKKARR